MTRRRTKSRRKEELIECVFAPRILYPPLPDAATLAQLDNVDDMDTDPAKVSRILDNATRYLRGDTLYLHSARLRGPVTKNPWASESSNGIKRKRDVAASPDRPDDAKKVHRDGRVVVDTPDGPVKDDSNLLRQAFERTVATTTTPPSIQARRTIEESFHEDLAPLALASRRTITTMAITADGSPRMIRTFEGIAGKRLPVPVVEKPKRRKPPLELSNTQSPAFAFRRKGKGRREVPAKIAVEERHEDEHHDGPPEEDAEEVGRENEVEAEADKDDEADDVSMTTEASGKSRQDPEDDTGATSPENVEVTTEDKAAEQEKQVEPVVEDGVALEAKKVESPPEMHAADAQLQQEIFHNSQREISTKITTEETRVHEAVVRNEEAREEGEVEVSEPAVSAPALGDQVQVARTPAAAAPLAKEAEGSSPKTPDSDSGASETSSERAPDDSPWVSTQYQLENTRKQFMAALMDTPSSRGRRTAEPTSEASRVPQSSLPLTTQDTPSTIALRQLDLTLTRERERSASPTRAGHTIKDGPSPFKTFTSPLASSPSRTCLDTTSNTQDDRREMRPIMLFTPQQQESLFSQHPIKTHDANWTDPADYSFMSDVSPEKENGNMFGFGGTEKNGMEDDGDQLTADVSSFFDAGVWDMEKELQRAGGENATPSQSKTGRKLGSSRAAWAGSGKRRW